MRIRIIIDDQDAADAPDLPLTLNVYHDEVDGTHTDFEALEAVIGSDVPTMLRELADRWEARPEEYEPEPAPTCTEETGHLMGQDHRWQDCPAYHDGEG